MKRPWPVGTRVICVRTDGLDMWVLSDDLVEGQIYEVSGDKSMGGNDGSGISVNGITNTQTDALFYFSASRFKLAPTDWVEEFKLT